MNILKLLLGKKRYNDYVYKHTEKPKEYVHVDQPKTLQEHRQAQYNNWCKRYGVYNGSYLPENPDTLTKKGKGWVETKGKPDGTVRNFTRKSSMQRIRYDKENKEQISHYHWKNAKSVQEERNITKEIQYKDRYGKECSVNDDRHHLAPLDKDCPKNAKKIKES